MKREMDLAAGEKSQAHFNFKGRLLANETGEGKKTQSKERALGRTVQTPFLPPLPALPGRQPEGSASWTGDLLIGKGQT